MRRITITIRSKRLKEEKGWREKMKKRRKENCDETAKNMNMEKEIKRKEPKRNENKKTDKKMKIAVQ